MKNSIEHKDFTLDIITCGRQGPWQPDYSIKDKSWGGGDGVWGTGVEQREEGALTKLRSGLQNVAAQGVHGETQ